MPRGVCGDIDYQSYVAQYQARGAQNVSSGAEVVVYGKDFVLTDMAGELIYAPEKDDYAVLTEEVGSMVWLIRAPEAGFYNLEIEYMPVPGRGISIERSVEINAEYPLRVRSIWFFPGLARCGANPDG